MSSVVTSAAPAQSAGLETQTPQTLEPSTRRARLDARLREFGSTGVGTILLTVAAPVEAAETFLDLGDLPESFLWQEPNGAAYAGQGAVHRLQVAGAERFLDLRRLAERALDGTVSEGVDGVPAVDPRLWGGLAFDENAASSAPWAAFGDGQLFMPRFLFRRHPENAESNGHPSATLTLGATAKEAADGAMRLSLLDQFEALLGKLKHPPLSVRNEACVCDEIPAQLESDTDDVSWVRQVEDIRRAIAEGDVEKIVAARRFRVAVDSDLEISKVLRRLGQGLRSSTRFAFRYRSASGDVTFLGATPERLVSKRGSRLETEALAGTMEAGGEHAAELLESGKNRHEQQLVTDSIVRRLRPLCSHLEVAERPTVRELRDMLHLHTPIRGVLKGEHHVLDLVQALHPTPAVGGVPTPEAMHWIAEHESHPRGWYAAPIGWLDARGDGEFYVALRSCVVAGGEAFLYAGAGIVGDSDPLAELRETELKTHALRKVLCS